MIRDNTITSLRTNVLHCGHCSFIHVSSHIYFNSAHNCCYAHIYTSLVYMQSRVYTPVPCTGYVCISMYPMLNFHSPISAITMSNLLKESWWQSSSSYPLQARPGKPLQMLRPWPDQYSHAYHTFCTSTLYDALCILTKHMHSVKHGDGDQEQLWLTRTCWSERSRW